MVTDKHALQLPRQMPRAKKKNETENIQRLQRTGKQQQAIAVLREFVKQSPDDSLAWFRLGAALDSSGKMADAIPCYLRALRLNPRHPHHYEMCLYLASSYWKTARPCAAGRWLKAAAAFGRDSPLQRRLQRLLAPARIANSELGSDIPIKKAKKSR